MSIPLPQEVVDKFESSESTIYAFNSEYSILFVNQKYSVFADENSGGDICARWGIGSSVFDPIPEPLLPFYKDFYEKAFHSKSLYHEYECSSPTEFRKFRLTTYLWPNENIVVAEHALIEHSSIEKVYVTHPFKESLFTDSNGLIKKCCHCNKTFNVVSGRWEFVPELLENSKDNISHGYCAVCSDYYLHEARRVAASIRKSC